MGRLVTLETFAPRSGAPTPTRTFSASEIEAARLEGYDAGYRAGWDDAMAAEREGQDRISEEFARNLRDLGFTYHEARAHVTSGVEQVLRAFLGKVFPAVMGEALAAHVEDALAPHIEAAAAAPIRLRVCPADAPALRRLLVSVASVPCEIEEEATLSSGQVHCVLGAVERQIDLAGVIGATEDALDALNEINSRMLRNG